MHSIRTFALTLSTSIALAAPAACDADPDADPVAADDDEGQAGGKADGFGATCEADLATMYVLSRAADGTRTLLRGSTADLSLTELGEIDYDGDLWELVPGAYGYLYTVDRGTDTLVKLSAGTGEVVHTTALDADMRNNGRGFARSPEGVLYGLFDGKHLRTIDAATGETTAVAQLQGIGGGVEAMTFCPDGKLFVAASPSGSPVGSHLYRVDVGTGGTTSIGRIGAATIDIDSLTCSAALQLYGADAVNTAAGADFQQVDPKTGTRILLGRLATGGYIDGVTMAP